MKAIIVYYSLTGNVEFVVNKISSILECDTILLSVLNPYPKNGFKKFFWGGKSAVMKEKPKLKEYNFDIDQYDVIIIGTPVWAGTFTPPIRTFIKENDLSNKRVFFVVSSGGGSARKAIDNMKKEIGINGDVISLELVDPKDRYNKDVDAKIEEFCRKVKVDVE